MLLGKLGRKAKKGLRRGVEPLRLDVSMCLLLFA